jgi:hypothetical protein
MDDLTVKLHAEPGRVGQRYFEVKTDGSLSYGLEVVSPVLQSRNAEHFVALDKALHIIRGLDDVRVSRECGLHVHVAPHGSPWNTDKLRNLAANFVLFEPMLDMFMPPSRRGNANRYCRSNREFLVRKMRLPCNDKAVRAMADVLCAYEDRESLSGGLTEGDRYYKMNPTSLGRHGTVEFRQHSGAVDPTKITNWTAFVLHFTAKSFSGVFCPKGLDTDRETDFGKMFSALFEGMPTELAEFYRRRLVIHAPGLENIIPAVTKEGPSTVVEAPVLSRRKRAAVRTKAAPVEAAPEPAGQDAAPVCSGPTVTDLIHTLINGNSTAERTSGGY